MAIAHESTGTALGPDSGTSHEVASPGSLTEGWLLWMLAYMNDDQLMTNSETGWTKVVEVQSDLAGDNTIACWWKEATDSEPATYTVTHSVSVSAFRGVVLAYSGVDMSNPIDVTATTVQDNNDSDTHDPADITPVTAEAMALVMLGGVQMTGTPSTPAGYTSREVTSSGGNRFGIWDKGGLAVATESPGQISGMGSGADTSSITVALRPETGVVVPVYKRPVVVRRKTPVLFAA